jgi:hypothetical protein
MQKAVVGCVQVVDVGGGKEDEGITGEVGCFRGGWWYRSGLWQTEVG